MLYSTPKQVILALMVFFGLAGVTAGETAKPAPAADPGPTQTITPTGDYLTARLTLKSEAIPPIFLSFRDNRAVAMWFIAAVGGRGWNNHWIDESTLVIQGSSLKGSLRGKYSGEKNNALKEPFDFDLTFDGQVSDGTITGTVTGRVLAAAGPWPVSGTITTEAQMQQRNALPAGKDWPWFWGAGAALRGPDTGATLVSDWKDARPAWRSEETIGIMMGTSDRSDEEHVHIGLGGAGSSPIVAGGCVYQFHCLPAGALPKDVEDKRREQAKTLTLNPTGQRVWVDMKRPRADDIIVCMDAATGKTVWKTVFPEKGFHFQYHKLRMFNPTPLAADGTLYVVNYGWRLYALDAKTGKALWEYDKAVPIIPRPNFIPSATMFASSIGPVVASGTVAFMADRMLVGLEAKTGRELWKVNMGNASTMFQPWTKDGVTRFVVFAQVQIDQKPTYKLQVSCLDPATGKAIWSQQIPDTGCGDRMYPLREGDLLVSPFNFTPVNSAGGDVGCFRLTASGLEQVWMVKGPPSRHDTYGITILGGHVYVGGNGQVVCLKLETGAQAASYVWQGGVGMSGIFFSANGRLFCEPEGHHSKQSFWMFDPDPANLRVLGELWMPLHPDDTAYAVGNPLNYPVVDGRIFIRGKNGIYCYDLRAAAKP